MADSSQRKIASKPTGAPAARKKTEKAGRPVAPNWYRLGYLIHDVSRMRRTLYDQRMKPEGITRSQWWVLANLFRHGTDGVMSSELAKMLDVGKVTLGRLIERLEKAGYVYRRPDKSDGRAKHVFITTSGYALIKRMRVITEELNQKISADLAAAQIEAMEESLARMKDTLRTLLAAENISELQDDEDE